MFLITIPFWTNLLIRTFAIMEVIRNRGDHQHSADETGRLRDPIQMLYTDFAIMLGMTYVYLPLMVLPVYASMEKLDFRLVEAGYDLYATRWRVLRRIILPLVKPGIIAGSILVFVPSLGAYVTPRVLGGGKNLMLGNLIELQFGQGRNWPLGGVGDHAAGHRDDRAACSTCAPRSGRGAMADRPFSIKRQPGFTTIAIVCFVMLYAPILTLVAYVFNAGSSIAVWEGFSWRWYAAAWENELVQDAAIRSLVVALCASLFATTLATMAALGTTRTRPYKGLTAIYAMINQPLMVPEIVTAVALLIVFAIFKQATGYSGLGYLISRTRRFAFPSPICRSARGWKAWTCRWKRQPPTSTRHRGRRSGV